jgi:N-acetylmuramic acid 6-phosphate (MurNAc-6-P) etherase
MAKAGCSKEEAKALLDQAEGYVSKALQLFQQRKH